MKKSNLPTFVSILCFGALISSGNEFVPLFDGETIDGWEGDPKFWRIEDGVIVGETTKENPTKHNTFLIWDGGEVADFELKVEFKLTNHNSGVQYRSFPLKDRPWGLGGYQADIADDPKWMGAAYGEQYKRLLASRGEKTVVGKFGDERTVIAQIGDPDEILSHIDPNGWNEYHITAVGNQIIQRINGVTTAEFSESTPERLEKGLIGLQLHAGPPMKVSFRNIRLRELNEGDVKKVLFLAGPKSHGYGAHEHKAGSHLLARALNESDIGVIAQVVEEGKWPASWMGYNNPSAIVIYSDGYEWHLAKDHQDEIQKLVDEGVGVACLHFAVEVEPAELGPTFLNWIGGFFEVGWSVNPKWDASFEDLPSHPVTRGVAPFSIYDEWYYHMRFRPDMEGITPILSAHPPVETLIKPRERHQERITNPTVRASVDAGEIQHVAWAYERPDGGLGFGFTGGDFHTNWMNDDFRKIVLNAIVWTAKIPVPEEGVVSRTPSVFDIEMNQDYPKPAKKR
ncbi:MAG: family 16 glycoside hydrolase [Verrucomicrobiota bacterium]